MNNDSTIQVGLDVHKDLIVAADAVGLGKVQSLGNIGILERDITKLCRRMQSKGSRVCFVYEAGPCGYGLYRSRESIRRRRRTSAGSMCFRRSGARAIHATAACGATNSTRRSCRAR